MRNTKRCWTALQYTKPWISSRTQVLKDMKDNQDTSIEDKEEMVRKSAFSKPPEDLVDPPPQRPGKVHQDINAVIFRQVPYNQAQKKAPRPDHINFRAMRLLWEWDVMQVTALIRQCIRLGFHRQAWKTAKGVMLRKPNKIEYMVVKTYRVISLLNFLGKLCEKVAVKMIVDWCKVHHILHEGQIRS